VKIVTKSKDDSVFVDGGYAGLTAKLKKFALRPGAHTIAVKAPDGRSLLNQRIEVLPGKTTEVYPNPAS
jgi:hypothetical protein